MTNTMNKTNRTKASTPAVSAQLAIQLGEWGDDGKLHYSNHVLGVTDLADAQKKWRQMVDYNGWGASEAPIANVVDTITGERTAKISYNGRLWDANGAEILARS